MNAAIKQMFLAASAMVERSYAPYSGIKVGACVRSTSGKLYSGCNVENSVYPLGHCAEVGAISSMVAAGEQRISEVAVVTEGAAVCQPCGACLQCLQEMAGPELQVHMCNTQGDVESTTLKALLPAAFDIKNYKK